MEIFCGISVGCLAFLTVRDCNKRRKNRNIDYKMYKEMRQFELTILRKIRNEKNILTRNLIINSEIDNYKFKTKYHDVLIECNSVYLYEYGNRYQIKGIEVDYHINKYRSRDNLKRKLMESEYYEQFAKNKLISSITLFNNLRDPFAREIFYEEFEEEIVYGNYERNILILEAREKRLELKDLIHGEAGM